jgi:hypothetical protein
MTVDLVQERIHIVDNEVTLVDFSAKSLLAISYGEDIRQVGSAIGLTNVSLGVGAFVPHPKGRRRFVAFTWEKDGNKGGAAFQVNKDVYRDFVSSLEDVSGKRAIDTTASAALTH